VERLSSLPNSLVPILSQINPVTPHHIYWSHILIISSHSLIDWSCKRIRVLNWALRCEGKGWSGGFAPRILNLSSICRWTVSFANRWFYPAEKNPHSLTRWYLNSPRAGLDNLEMSFSGIEPRLLYHAVGILANNCLRYSVSDFK
jgi:hypothetical protein